ncbi:MAG TPA: alpha/beta hydrolase [Candidatus Pacearchaeota archaeon]|nr:alpha/beta hydrolase [Candidatus Pacearchaeota archaeon]HOK94130.1 alpha/beta hydrolase [Candidatus Pacearchaeota archaeon]HPO75258.1 alpha/beta hydrolase [Candidatus Pacearchaeota archaeon]
MEKQKLLILHGWGSNSERWQKVKEIIEKEGIDILIPNLPGFGFTPPPEKPWGVDDYLNWVLNFLKENNWQKFNLLGHSFGGGISVRLAQTHPEMIEKLILCAPAVIRNEKPKRILFFSSLGSVGKKILSLPGFKKLYPVSQKLISKIYGSKDYYAAEGVMKDTFKKVISEDLKFALEEIKAPTLILWGDKDEMLPVEHAYILHQKIKNSKLIIFPGGKHSLNIQMPEKIAESILKFLKS